MKQAQAQTETHPEAQAQAQAKHLTVNNILELNPCNPPYTSSHITELFAGRETLTPVDILLMENIPPADRLWVVLREAVLPARILQEFACRVAEQNLQIERAAGREPDPRSWAAPQAKRAWLNKQITTNVLRSAWTAAGNAASEAESRTTRTTRAERVAELAGTSAAPPSVASATMVAREASSAAIGAARASVRPSEQRSGADLENVVGAAHCITLLSCILG